MKKRLFNTIITLITILSLCACSQGGFSLGSRSNSPVNIQPYLENGDYVWMIGGAGGVTKGKYLKFKLTNTSSEDYLVQFTLLTKGKTQESESSTPRDYVFEIPNIFVPAYANSEKVFFVYRYNRKGYYKTDSFQFFGLNYDGSCLAETVEVKNVTIVKASDHPEKAKIYTLNDGRLAYDTQGAMPDNGY